MLYIYNPIALAINRKRLAEGKAIGRKGIVTAEGFLRIICLPTFVTMLIAGGWHGAGRQFLAFGLLHGFFICVNHAWRTFVPKTLLGWGAGRLGTAASVLITFLAVLSAQVFFRADSVQDAFSVLRGAIGVNGAGIVPRTGMELLTWLALSLLLAGIWCLPNTQEILSEKPAQGAEIAGTEGWSFLRWQPTLRWRFAIGLAFFACFVMLKSASRFLYFQF